MASGRKKQDHLSVFGNLAARTKLCESGQTAFVLVFVKISNPANKDAACLLI